MRAAAVAASVFVVVAKNILEFPLDVRRTNVVRVSHLPCEECTTLDDFAAKNSIAFVLFFERALVGQHHYKQSIINGFHSVCEDLRYSYVVCGAVDMVEDKAYAERFIDAKTAPAHILIRDGELIRLDKRHVDLLMAKPGDKATILWHLRDLLTVDSSSGALDVSAEVSGAEPLQRFVLGHRLVIAATATRDDEDARELFRAAAQRVVLKGDVPRALEPPTDEKKSKSATSKAKKPVGFVLALGTKALAGSNLTKGTAAAFVDGRKVEERPLTLKGASEGAVAEVLRSLAGPGSQAAEEAAQKAATAGGGRKKPAKERKKKGKQHNSAEM